MPFLHPLHIFVAVTLLLLGGWFFWPSPPPLLPTAGTAIVIFGDSLAAGIGATTGGDIASRLSAQLASPVLNLGIPGDTTADGLARVDTLLDTDPRIAIILLGGNDAIKKLPIEQTFTNLAAIIERVQAAGAAVILVGEPGALYGSRYEDEYERLAKTYRTFYIPNILFGLIGRTEYMSDYIHPNDAGYARAAERILPVIKEALGD